MSSPATPSPGGQLPPAGTYLIDPARSVVEVTTRHLFGLAGVKATFRLREGTLVIADPPVNSTASAVLDAGSFASGNSKRDQDVSSKKYLDEPAIQTSPSRPARCSRTGLDGSCAAPSPRTARRLPLSCP